MELFLRSALYLHVVQRDSFTFICSAQNTNPIYAYIRTESDTKVLPMQNTETTRQAMCVRRNLATRSQNTRTPSAIPKIWYRITRRQRFGRSVPPASTKRKKFHVKWPTFFQIVIRFRFSWNIFTKVSDIKKNYANPSGGRRADACRWKDRQTYYVTKVTGSFGDWAKARKNKMQIRHMHSFLEILCDKQEWIRLETKFLLKNLESKIYS